VTDDRDPTPSSKPTAGRFSRFAKMTGLTAGVAARHVTQKMMSAFQSDDDAERSKRGAEMKSAQQITKTLGEMKGAAMKIGQLLSTDPELLPADMVHELAKLQSSAPAMDAETVRAVVGEALGGSVDDHFSWFSEEPIGSASIGQVHRATTKDGQDVAVKVQYPGIADAIRSDMKNMGALLGVMRAALPKERVDGYLDEVRSVIERESDYLQEALNLERFQVVLKDVAGVRVPIPVHELTRKNVLTMEFLPGVRLEEWLKDATPEQKNVQGTRLIRMTVESMHRHGVLHADPHPGNFLVLTGEAAVDGAPPIGLLDLGAVRDYDIAFADGLIRLLSAMWRHDLELLQKRWRAMGFIDRGVDPEDAYEWLSFILEPILVDKEFDFGTWQVQEKALAFVLEHPSIKLWAPPREVIFYLRVLAGLRGLLFKTGIRVNAYRLSRDVAAERGLLD
jgi:predicted unusual protein kinase regulating ubiquinone biosynthesis (AarF/ABC1/UbiB family)